MKAIVFAGLLGLAACDDGAGGMPTPDATQMADASPDAAVDGSADARDAAREPPLTAFPGGCACDDGETCAACFARIGECCYEDPTIVGQAARLAQLCEARNACRICCRECAALPCEVLIRGDNCPNGARAE